MALTINNNPSKYDLWTYDGSGRNPIGPNYNNIFILNGIQNIFCVSVNSRSTASVPNGPPASFNCNGSLVNSSGSINGPFVIAISPHCAVGSVKNLISAGQPIRFWYKHANGGSGGFITRTASNIRFASSLSRPYEWVAGGYYEGTSSLYSGSFSDVLVYFFDEPLPVDADFAVLPIFNDYKMWRKNSGVFPYNPGVIFDHDSRMVPGSVFMNFTEIYDSDQIGGVTPGASDVRITGIDGYFLSDLNSISDKKYKENYLKYLDEDASYYDNIFRIIKGNATDSTSPIFEVDFESNCLILYSLATILTNNRNPSWIKSQNNYNCFCGIRKGNLVSVNMFGLDYFDRSENPYIRLGKDFFNTSRLEGDLSIPGEPNVTPSDLYKIPVKSIDSEYVNKFYLGFDVLDYNKESRFSKAYSLGYSHYFYLDNYFDSSDPFDGPFIPNGPGVPFQLRNSFNVSGTINYFSQKYPNTWDQNSSKNLVIGIYGYSGSGTYGSFTVVSDFKNAINQDSFSGFDLVIGSASFKEAKSKIIKYISDIKAALPNMKIGWSDLVGYSNWYPPYVYGDLPESEKSWLSVNDSQKSLIFNCWDKIWEGVIEKLDFISFSFNDNVNRNSNAGSDPALWHEVNRKRAEIAIEYVKRYCYRKNIRCPKILPCISSCTGENIFENCDTSNLFSHANRPISDVEFIERVVSPCVDYGVDGFIFKNNSIFEEYYDGWINPNINIDSRRKLSYNYICNSASSIDLSDCSYYNLINNYSPCIASQNAQNVINSIFSYVENKMSVLSRYLVDFEAFGSGSSSLKNFSLITEIGMNPWDTSAEQLEKYSLLNYDLFNSTLSVDSYMNYTASVLADSFIENPIYSNGVDWDPDNTNISIYSYDSTYSTGNLVKFFDTKTYRWCVFQATQNVSVGDYPGRINYFSTDGSGNREYYRSNINIRWKCADINFLYSHYSLIPSINKYYENNKLSLVKGRSKYKAYDLEVPWTFLPVHEANYLLYYDQGVYGLRNGYEYFNFDGGFVNLISSGFGYSHELGADLFKNFYFSSIDSLFDLNKGIISDFIFWYKNISEDKHKKSFTDNFIYDLIFSYDFNSASYDEFDKPQIVSRLGISENVTRYQIFEYQKYIIPKIERIIKEKSHGKYVMNSGDFRFDCGLITTENTGSRDDSGSQGFMVNSLRQLTESTPHVSSWDSFGRNISSIGSTEYYEPIFLPQFWFGKKDGLYDVVFERTRDISIFTSNYSLNRFVNDSLQMYSADASIITFKVLNNDENSVSLISEKDQYGFIFGLGVKSISLIIESYEEQGSQVRNRDGDGEEYGPPSFSPAIEKYWICNLSIEMNSQDSQNNFERKFGKIFFNKLMGNLHSDGLKFFTRWKINKKGVVYPSTFPVGSFNPSSLYHLLEQDDISIFDVNNRYNASISLWSNSEIMFATNSYTYSAKSLSSLPPLSGGSGYYPVYKNGQELYQFNSDHSGIEFISNALDSKHYEELKNHFSIFDPENKNTLMVRSYYGLLPLWMSKYGLDDPQFRYNTRYSDKNLELSSKNSREYTGFLIHSNYGRGTSAAQTPYESYEESVASLMKVAKNLSPNKVIVPFVCPKSIGQHYFISCLYHPKEFCYYLVRPWFIGNYRADAVHVWDSYVYYVNSCFYDLSNYSEPAGFRTGIEMAIFNGNMLSIDDAWNINNSSSFDWNSVEKGGMLWDNYGEKAMINLEYTSLNGNDSYYEKPKIVIFIKEVVSLYLKDLYSELNRLLQNPEIYERPSDKSIGYDVLSFLNGLLVSCQNELKVEIVGGGSYSSENWVGYKIEWYKSKSYVDNPDGFELIYTESGVGFIQYIYAPRALTDLLANGDVIKAKLHVNTGYGLNSSSTYECSLYFDSKVNNIGNYFIPSSVVNTREKNILKIVNSEQIAMLVDPPSSSSSSSGSFNNSSSSSSIPLSSSSSSLSSSSSSSSSLYIPGGNLPEPSSALDYEVWAAHWSGNMFGVNNPEYGRFGHPNYELLSIVPGIPIFGTNYNGFRMPSDTNSASITSANFQEFKNKITSVPSGRRVMLPYYWLPDIGCYTKLHDQYYRNTSDGVVYDDGTRQDRILTCWLDNNSNDCADSFRSFLQRCINDGFNFDYIMNNQETQDNYWIDGRNSYPNWLDDTDGDGYRNDPSPGIDSASFMHDARRVSAIMSDSRFTSYVNPYTGKTFAQEFMENYQALRVRSGLSEDSRSWQQILAPFANANSPMHFRSRDFYWQAYGCSDGCSPDGITINGLVHPEGYNLFFHAVPAWRAAADSWHFNVYWKRFRDVLGEFAEFLNTIHMEYTASAVNSEEAKFFQLSNMEISMQPALADSWTGSSRYYAGFFNIIFPNWALPPDGDYNDAKTYCSGYVLTPQNEDELFNWCGYLVQDYKGPSGESNLIRYPETDVYPNATGFDPSLVKRWYTEYCFKYLVHLIKLERVHLRSDPNHWEKFVPWIGYQGYSEARWFNGDVAYYHEMIRHTILNGARIFQVFESSYAPDSCRIIHEILDEWRSISGNSRAQPCSNEFGDVSQPVDRMVLKDVFENVLISGGRLVEHPDWYIWRISVAPKHFNSDGICILTKQIQDQDLPDTIIIDSNTSRNNDDSSRRGVWVQRNVPGAPIYSVATFSSISSSSSSSSNSSSVSSNNSSSSSFFDQLAADVDSIIRSRFQNAPSGGSCTNPPSDHDIMSLYNNPHNSTFTWSELNWDNLLVNTNPNSTVIVGGSSVAVDTTLRSLISSYVGDYNPRHGATNILGFPSGSPSVPNTCHPRSRYVRVFAIEDIPKGCCGGVAWDNLTASCKCISTGTLDGCESSSTASAPVLCSCNDRRIKKALSEHDTSCGHWIKTTGVQTAFAYRAVKKRIEYGGSIGSGASAVSGAAAQQQLLTDIFDRCMDILREINKYTTSPNGQGSYDMMRNGWTIANCSDNPNVNDGPYLGTAWGTNGLVRMLDLIGPAVQEADPVLYSRLGDQLRSEVLQMVDDWKNNRAWYMKGHLGTNPCGSGTPNTNQWIEPVCALINASLFLIDRFGQTDLKPAYNMGVCLLGFSVKNQFTDGGFAEGWGYAVQCAPEMFFTMEMMNKSGDFRIRDAAWSSDFVNNYWNWFTNHMLPGNYIANYSDCRAQQVAYWALSAPYRDLPLSSEACDNANKIIAYNNFTFLFPGNAESIDGIKCYSDKKALTALNQGYDVNNPILNMSNFANYADSRIVFWRTGRAKPSDIDSSSASSHFALWVKGGSLKDGHKHRDEGQFAIYCGKKSIILESGMDYDIDTAQQDALADQGGHNILQIGAKARGTLVDCPMTVSALSQTNGDVSINLNNSYTSSIITSCNRRLQWSHSGILTDPLSVTVTDSVVFAAAVLSTQEIFRFHTGRSTDSSGSTNSLTVSGSGISWNISWPGVTMSISSNIPIVIANGFAMDFTQLLPYTQSSINNPRYHRIILIKPVNNISANSLLTLTTSIIANHDVNGG